MNDRQPLQRFLESALAFAHSALERPDARRVRDAHRYAAEVVPRLRRIQRFEFTLGEARQIVLLMQQLCAVLAAVDQRLAATG
jgi:hypothetical protein